MFREITKIKSLYPCMRHVVMTFLDIVLQLTLDILV